MNLSASNPIMILDKVLQENKMKIFSNAIVFELGDFQHSKKSPNLLWVCSGAAGG